MGTTLHVLPDNSPSMEAGKRSGRGLAVMRIVFGVVFIVLLVALLASMPVAYRQLISLDYPEVGQPAGWSEAETRAALAELGWTVQIWAGINLSFLLGSVFLFFGTAALIFWQKKDDWMGIYVPWLLVAIAVPLSLTPAMLAALPIDPRITSIFWNFLFFQVFWLLYIFPDGRFVPLWTRWFVVAWTYLAVAMEFPGTGFNPDEWPAPIMMMFDIVLISSLVFAPVYRYIRVSNRIQRLQTRWVILGIIGALAGFILTWSVIASAIRPALDARSPQGLLGELFIDFFGFLSIGLIPATLTIAILRYRLWDIDVIIRKTLVYSAVTGLLALVYFGGVLLLQGLFSRLGAGQSPAVLVLSTLLIAALFSPLRKRVQESVDRRFYRKKYDAEGALAAFTAQARDEVDIERLSAALVGAVEETVQPVETSLWLRSISGTAKPGTGARQSRS